MASWRFMLNRAFAVIRPRNQIAVPYFSLGKIQKLLIHCQVRVHTYRRTCLRFRQRNRLKNNIVIVQPLPLP